MSDNSLAIIQLVNTLAQLAQASMLSMQDLIAAKERANNQGRAFGVEDVDRLIAQSRADVEEFERRLGELDENGN